MIFLRSLAPLVQGSLILCVVSYKRVADLNKMLYFCRPGTNYGKAFVIYDGQGFRVLAQKGQWYRIKMGFYGGGRIGWTHEQNINWCEDPNGTGI